VTVIDRRFPLDQVDDERVRLALQILTTEHFNLQSARSATISESVGRLSTFLGTISGVLIALGFSGQLSAFGTPFKAFTLVLLPSILVLGIVTCARVAQTSMEDIHYIAGINRIHHFYVEVVPEIADYLVGSIHDDFEGSIRGMGLRRSRWQPFLSIVGLIAMVNSLIAGVIAALVVAWVGDAAIPLVVIAGILVGVAVFGAHLAVGVRTLARRDRERPALFPSPMMPGGSAGAGLGPGATQGS
jgi:lysylphosphatidylglycerol synthetase-like protein (DUF2156 family)